MTESLDILTLLLGSCLDLSISGQNIVLNQIYKVKQESRSNNWEKADTLFARKNMKSVHIFIENRQNISISICQGRYMRKNDLS